MVEVTGRGWDYMGTKYFFLGNHLVARGPGGPAGSHAGGDNSLPGPMGGDKWAGNLGFPGGPRKNTRLRMRGRNPGSTQGCVSREKRTPWGAGKRENTLGGGVHTASHGRKGAGE